MNRVKAFSYLLIGLVCVATVTSGCRRKPTALTYVPGQTHKIGDDKVKPMDLTDNNNKNGKVDGNPLNPNDDPNKVDPNKVGGIPLPDRNKRENMNEDREFFKANTVYFEFDKAAVRKSEQEKVQAVANALKARPDVCVEVEGHCDERGTEEYNRALGEKRALSVREYIINLGISSERVFTISFGEDKPAVNGHTEAAWTKNRRGEFILLTPKK
jgi:peptidoglycan-associated lipoprotein